MSTEKETMINEIKSRLNNICEDDLKTMFQTSFASSIITNATSYTRMVQIMETINEYNKYQIPCWIGDIILYDKQTWIVTCVYTDNSVDLLSKSEKIKKINTGLYLKNFAVIGQLEKITV